MRNGTFDAPHARPGRIVAGVLATGLTLGSIPVAIGGVFPAEFELSSLFPANGGDGSTGFVLNGVSPDDWSGWSVSAAGDVNGDGLDDLVIGAVFADPAGRIDAGKTYVLFGRDTAQTGNFPAIFPLAALLAATGGDGSAGFVLNGIEPGDESGDQARGAGDVNGDGISDLIIGAEEAAPLGHSQTGQSYIVFGRDTSQTGTFPPELPLATLHPLGGGDGSAGLVLDGIKSFDSAGRAVNTAGDINGDGIADVVVTAPLRGDGEIYVVFGRSPGNAFPALLPLASLHPAGGGDGSAGFVLSAFNPAGGSALAGQTVSTAGDVNGDGIDDLIIGAPRANPGGHEGAGRCYVIFGRNTSDTGNFPPILALASLLSAQGGDGSVGFVLNGIASGSQLNGAGDSVGTAGDINDDGIADVIVGDTSGSPGGRLEAGQAYVVFGRDTAQVGGFPPEIELSSLLPANGGDGSTGFILNGVDRSDGLGASLGAVGDVNSDGISDVILGVDGSIAQSYVVFGRDADQAGGFPPEFELSTLLVANGGDGSTGFALNGIRSSDFSGTVSGAGDLDGDGVDDLIIAAPFADPGRRLEAGQAYVVFGRSATNAR